MDALFTPWRPDVPGFSEIISGVEPIAGGRGVAYGPIRILNPFSAALDAAPRGFLSCTKADGTRINIAATASTLELLSGDSTWTELDNGYTLPDDYDWTSVKFGDVALWSNSADGLFEYNVETPAGVNAVSGAPDFYRIWVQQVRLLGVYFSTYWRVACSGVNNHTLWNGAGGSDELPLKDGGEVMTGCAVGPYSVILQKDAIRRVTVNAQPGRVLAMEDIITGDGVGAVSAKSVIPFRGMVAFISAAGPQLLIGGEVRPIGAEKVSRWLVDYVSDLSTIRGGVDPQQHLFKWQINASEQLVYDFQLDEFTLVPQATTFLCAAGLPASDMDASEVLTDDANMDNTVLPHFDSKFWAGSDAVSAGFSTDYKLGLFDGATCEATLRTAEVEFPKSVDINDASVLTDADTVYVTVGTADSNGEDLTYSDEVSTSEGVAYLLNRGKRAVGQMRIPQGTDWTEARGLGFVNEGGR